MKGTDSTEEASGFIVKGKIKELGTQKEPEASRSFSCYFYKKSGDIKKNCMKYKEMLKKEGGTDSDGASTSES